MNDFEHFNAAQQIAAVVLSYGKRNRQMEDRRVDSPISNGPQTVQGFYWSRLNGFYGELWTPWGMWFFGGSAIGNWDVVVPKIISRLQAVAIDDKSLVYAVHAVDELALPDPVRRTDANLSYSDVMTVWSRLQSEAKK